MQVGICGYPGSGKTTVFRALSPGASRTRNGVTLGNIKVSDDRVDRLAAIFHPKKTTYAEITFVDVGGAGSHARAKALSSEVVQAMRNADVLVHVVRAFTSPFHPDPPTPEHDVTAFDEELMLLDLDILERRGARFDKERRTGPEVEVNTRCVEWLEEGRPLRDLGLEPPQIKTLAGIQLLSLKPIIVLHNVGEEDIGSPPPGTDRPDTLAICGPLEAEIASMPEADQAEFVEGLGLGEPARNEFIRAAYRALDLISFLTAGPDECRAWPVKRGSTARQAAGRIHSDLARGFIRAEIYRVDDLESHGSEAALKAAGLIRIEGKDYIVQDGDVMNVRFKV